MEQPSTSAWRWVHSRSGPKNALDRRPYWAKWDKMSTWGWSYRSVMNSYTGPSCKVFRASVHCVPELQTFCKTRFQLATLQVRLGHMFTSKRHTCQAHLFEVKNPLCSLSSLTNQQLSILRIGTHSQRGNKSGPGEINATPYTNITTSIEDMPQIFTGTKPN